MAIKARGLKGYMMWLKEKQPRVYGAIKHKLGGNSVAGLGDLATTAPETAVKPSLLDTLKNLATTAAQVYLTKEQLKQQSKLQDIQLQRAAQGLAPLDIDPSQYGLQATGRVGLTEDTKKLFMIGGLGLLAVFAISQMRSRHR